MAQRLFQGQIRPAAQPLGAFITPGKNNIPGAARPSQMPATSRIATLQQAGTSSVAGFNQFKQLADALVPFGKQLSSVVNKGFRQYAINNIEAGYYDTLKNDEVKAKLRAQENKEQGAVEAANTIGALERVDPVAGQLARETNPWRAVGRNRALAQLAASEIPAAFAEELYGNQGELSGLKPGSPELMKKKIEITQKVNQRFGLSKDELEYTYYVTPTVNKTWDKFTQDQAKLYNEEISYQTRALGAQTINAWFEQVKREGGINDGAGFVLQPDQSIEIPGQGVFSYGSLGAAGLTERIEKTLSLLGGKDKADAWKELRGILSTYRGENPALFGQIVNEVRVGPAVNPVTGERIKYADRATYAQTYPMELADNTSAFLQAQNKTIQERQASVKNKLEDLWYSRNGPGSFIPGSKAYQDALTDWQVEATSLQYQDRDGLADTLNKDTAATFQAREQPTVEEVLTNNQAFSNITPEQVSTAKGIKELRQKAQQMAAKESYGNAGEAEERLNYYNKIIDDSIKKQGRLPQGIDRASTFSGWVRSDVAGSQFGAKASQAFNAFNLDLGSGQTFEQALINGNMETPQKSAALSFASQVRALYATEFDKLRREWWTQNPNAPEMPPTAALEILDVTKTNVRNSNSYTDAIKNAIDAAKIEPSETNNQSPAGPTPGDPESEDETKQKPRYSKSSSQDISQGDAREYQNRLVISGGWLRDELVSITKNGYASAEMNALANKAGTSSLVFLRKQLDQVQAPGAPEQEARIFQYMKFLDRKIRNEQSSALPIQTNYEYAMQPSSANYKPRAPGAWLMAELFPSAA